MVDGRPTGSVRVSFGYMSTFEDCQKFLGFVVECFVEKPVTLDQVRLEKLRTATATRHHTVKAPPIQITDRTEEKGDEKQKPSDTSLSGCGHGSAYTLTNIYIYPIKSCAAFEVWWSPHCFSVSVCLVCIKQSNLRLCFPLFLDLCAPLLVCKMWRARIVIGPRNKWVFFDTVLLFVQVNDWPMGPKGLLYDRCWMVVNRNGVCLSQKREPRLCLIQPQVHLSSNKLLLQASGQIMFQQLIEKHTVLALFKNVYFLFSSFSPRRDGYHFGSPWKHQWHALKL